MLAMIEVVGEHGYRDTTVAGVIERAGVSRKAFYEQFANKAECLLTTADLISAEGVRQLEEAQRGSGGWPENVEAAIRALFTAVINNPSALRLSMLEIAAVGPAGIERRERSIGYYERFVREAVLMAPGEGTLADIPLNALVGALYRILYRRVLWGEAATLDEMIPGVLSWAISYYPTPAAILDWVRPAEADDATALSLIGGRAPGTLAPHPQLGGRRGLPRGTQNSSPHFVAHNQRERILDAIANLSSSSGYASVKVEDIATLAAVSTQAFYQHFSDKEDAFLVAYEVGHRKGLAIVEQAFIAQPDWRKGVRAAIRTLFEFLASEPSFARLALVEAQIATTQTAKRSQIGVDSYAQMLLPAAEDGKPDDLERAITIEATIAGLFALCFEHASKRTLSDLPSLTTPATYFALAPFIGPSEAAKAATTGA